MSESWLLLRAYRGGCLLPGRSSPTSGTQNPAVTAEVGRQAAEAIVPMLYGACDPAEVLRRIGAQPVPLLDRVNAAKALGALVASVVALGARECNVAGGILRVTPEAAQGFVDAPAIAAAA